MLSLSTLTQRLGQKQKAYKLTFGAPGTAAHDAFVDLGRFCHVAAGSEIVEGNHDRTLRLAGRREAFFHIWKNLNLSLEDLVAIYPKIATGDEQ